MYDFVCLRAKCFIHKNILFFTYEVLYLHYK